MIGVSCYSSKDVVNWKYEGLALKADETNAESIIHPSKVLERPKVLYNEKTKKFVMWFHADTADYVYAGVGVAISDTPCGPFTFLGAKQPNRQDSRDMTLFQDNDGAAYLLHSKDWNKTLNIARLTKDYLDTDGFYISVLVDQEREAPAIWYRDNKYYMMTSGCTGWNYNSALLAESPMLLGQWKLIDNPCEGEGYRQTFKGQSTYVFRVGNKEYLMLDHWVPSDLKTSGYSILPITYDECGNVIVHWTDEWNGVLE